MAGDRLSPEPFVDAVAVDPNHPNAMYAGTDGTEDGLFKSTDGGATWSAKINGLPRSDHEPDAYVHSLVIDPAESATIYAGLARYGVYKSTDRARFWAPANAGLPLQGVVQSLAIAPSTPDTVYAATSSDGVYKTTDGGGTWSAVNTGLGDPHVQSLAVDPSNPAILYAATSRGVFKTKDGGAGWQPVGLSDRVIEDVAVSPGAPGTVYAGTKGHGVSRSSDRGRSWNAMNNGLFNPFVLALAVDLPMETVFAGTAGNGVFEHGLA